MGLYYYKAIDTVGRMISGQLDANNPVDLEQRLQRSKTSAPACLLSASSPSHYYLN